MSATLLLAGGLALLLIGGDALVRGAAALALRLRAPHLVVGLAVGFGTSAPELVLAVDAALQNAEALALGNVMGANVTNATLVLGVQALLARRQAAHAVGARASLFLVAGAGAVAALGFDGTLDRFDAAVLLVLFGVFLWDQIARAPREQVLLEEIDPDDGRLPLVPALLLCALGLGLLPIGATIAVEGAIGTARAIGVSEGAIGLTVTSFGTTLPELATALAVVRRGHHAIGVGNVIGSIVFNGLAIIGIVGMLRPLSMPAELWHIALPAYLVAVALATLVATGRLALERRTGAALIGLYAAYLATVALIAR
jgi:cation:H+ antiporter